MSITIPVVTAGGTKSTVVLPDPVVNTTPPTGTLYTAGNGDFSVGKFGQWSAVHSKVVNHTGVYYDTNFGPNYPYPATIVNEGGVFAARFEVRQGDPGI